MSTPECNPGCLPRLKDYFCVSEGFMLIVAGVAFATGKFLPYGSSTLVLLHTPTELGL